MSTIIKKFKSDEELKPETLHIEKHNDLSASEPHTSPNADFVPDSNTVGGSDFKWNFDVITNLAALYFTYFSSSWMLVVPSSVIGFIAEAYPLDSGTSSWIAASVTIGTCILFSFLGSLSDSLGRKWVITIGPLLMIIGSLIAGRATSMGMVIGGQVISGIGIACGYNAIAFTVEVVPKSKRPLIQALAGLFAGTAFIGGPIIAGAFIVNNIGGLHNGWRASFYLGAGFNLISFVMLLIFYYPSRRPNPHNLTIWQRVLKIDWPGVFLIAAGLTILLVGLQYGGNPDKWDSAKVLSCIIVGAALICAFVFYEWKVTKVGLLHHGLFTHRNFGLCLGLNFVAGIMLFTGQAYIPQETIYLFTRNAVLTGVYSLPFNVCTILGAFIVGAWMAITKECQSPTTVSFVFLLIGGGLMAVVEPHINFAAWFFPTLLTGLSTGMQASTIIVISSLCTPDHLVATAVTLINATRSLGGSIGVVIFNVIFQDKIKKEYPSQVTKAVLAAGLPPGSLPALVQASAAHNQTAVMQVPGITPHILQALQDSAEQAYADSFRFVWYSFIPFAVIAIIGSLFIKSTKAQMTNSIASEVQHRHHHHHDAHDKTHDNEDDKV